MRYVDGAQLEDELDQAWHERADAAYAETMSCQSEERATVINKGGDVWRDAGRAAARLTAGRCWYCDMRQVRSDMPVDHFRPKGRVAEEKSHPGYWWLAFDWKNFRYSCTFCNSRRVDVDSGSEGGKQDHFPL